MNAKENVVGKIVKVEKQPPVYDGKLLCPVCECQGDDVDWEQFGGKMRVICDCWKCGVGYEVWFSLNYAEHRDIVDLNQI